MSWYFMQSLYLSLLTHKELLGTFVTPVAGVAEADKSFRHRKGPFYSKAVANKCQFSFNENARGRAMETELKYRTHVDCFEVRVERASSTVYYVEGYKAERRIGQTASIFI